MKSVTVPELFLIASTRAALGAGLALLFGEGLSYSQRRAIGWTLVVVGVVSTIPLAAEVLFREETPGNVSDRLFERTVLDTE